jgi:hypothetical protein
MHSFPSGEGTLKSTIAYQASNQDGSLGVDQTGTVLLCSAKPSKLQQILLESSMQSALETSIGRKMCQAYHKPDSRPRTEMLRLFQIGHDGTSPMLNRASMQNDLRKMRDKKDGGLVFCYSKRGSFPQDHLCKLCNQKACNCNDMLPPLWMCQQFYCSQTQEKKKKKKKKDKGAKGTNPGMEEAESKRSMIAHMSEDSVPP